MFCYSLFPTVLYWQPLVSVFFKKLFGCTIKQETFLSFSASRYSYIDGVCWIFQPKMPFQSTMCVLLAWSLIIIFYFITSIVKTLTHWICVSSLYATLPHIKKNECKHYFFIISSFTIVSPLLIQYSFCSLTHEIFIDTYVFSYYYFFHSQHFKDEDYLIFLFFGHSLIPKWQHSRNGHDSHNNTSACRLKCNKVCFLNLYWQHSQMYPFLPFFILIFRLLIYSFQVYLWICF